MGRQPTRKERGILYSICGFYAVRIAAVDGHSDLLAKIPHNNTYFVSAFLQERDAVVPQEHSDGVITLGQLGLP